MWANQGMSANGTLSLNEANRLIKECFGDDLFDKKDIDGVFHAIDTDGDGRVNKGEMAKFVVRLTKF